MSLRVVLKLYFVRMKTFSTRFRRFNSGEEFSSSINAPTINNLSNFFFRTTLVSSADETHRAPQLFYSAIPEFRARRASRRAYRMHRRCLIVPARNSCVQPGITLKSAHYVFFLMRVFARYSLTSLDRPRSRLAERPRREGGL